MRKTITAIAMAILPLMMLAQGWPANYGGVMLQGFSWDNYTDPRWSQLEKNAPELAEFFDLIWVPQSGQCGKSSPGTSMGYNPLYYFKQNSTFGTEAELRSMIQTYKGLGTGIIADVVINHRGNWSTWVDFPTETYKGVTYQMVSTDICRNDDGGETASHTGGLSLSANNDTGEDWSGMRDLDHKSENVQKCVKAYEDFLLNDLGYAGFRYDMTKGFSASFIADYNSAANVQFSVGENWDGNASALSNWLSACNKDGVRQSATFDFNFRYQVRDVVRGKRDNGNTCSWKDLTVPTLVSNANKRYVVTFVENHDMQDRGAVTNYYPDPISKDTLAANAFLLAMPGTPCVFLPHWKAYSGEIKQMIELRKLVGIHNMSTAQKFNNNTSYDFSVFRTTGNNGQMLVVVGPGAKYYDITSQSTFNGTEVLSGYHYRMFISSDIVTVMASLPSGKYREAQNVTFTGVNMPAGAKLVYTTDGSTPTASSAKWTSGTSMTIKTATTIKMGVLASGTVSGVRTFNYDFVDTSKEKTITIYVNIDAVASTWNKGVNYHTWGGDNSRNTTWPGAAAEGTKVVNGKTWYYRSFILNGDDDFANFVFNTGTGSPQTIDINNVTTDKYYEVSATLEGTKHTVNDVTAQHSGIDNVAVPAAAVGPVKVYTIDGRYLGTHENVQSALQSLDKGLYIIGGKKYVK